MSETNAWRRVWLLSAAGGLAAWLSAAVAPAQEPSRALDLASFPRTSLEITHRGSDHTTRKFPFQVWVADTPARAEQDTDPLGRPLRGHEYGDDSTVKVPGEIDVQRARRILEELRRRFGDTFRPQIELDYIERLLKDF